MKSASLVATTVRVHCPHCGEPQPAPDYKNLILWVASDVKEFAEGPVGCQQCVCCDKPFMVTARTKATIDYQA